MLETKGVCGAVDYYMHSIEWQLLGLPHLHALIWLSEKLRISQIDELISAELPDPDLDPRLYAIIVAHNIHGPCGKLNPRSPCMKNGTCGKGYPKPFAKETYYGQDGFVNYRRRSHEDGGRRMTLVTNHGTFEIDSTWIVPYNPLIAKMFNCHTCMLSADSPLAVSYVCGYACKGERAATITTTTKKSRANAGRDPRDEPAGGATEGGCGPTAAGATAGPRTGNKHSNGANIAGRGGASLLMICVLRHCYLCLLTMHNMSMYHLTWRNFGLCMMHRPCARSIDLLRSYVLCDGQSNDYACV